MSDGPEDKAAGTDIYRHKEALAETTAFHTKEWLRRRSVYLTDEGYEKLIDFFRYYTKH